MGLFGGFKAKFRARQPEPKANKNVVCVKYNVFNEFDPQPGQSSSRYQDISNGNVQSFRPRPKAPPPRTRAIEDEIRKQLENGAIKRQTHTNGTRNEETHSILKQTPIIESAVKREFHPSEVKQEPKTVENPTKYEENARKTSDIPPVVNYSTHPLMSGTSPTKESNTFEPTTRTLTLDNTNQNEEETDEEEDESNFKIHFVSHDKVYATDDEEETEESEEEEIEEQPETAPPSPMDFSSQAASIFFGGDEEEDQQIPEEIVQRPRKVTVYFDEENEEADEGRSSQSSSASA